jgi:broad specificity phosphatase PhoE
MRELILVRHGHADHMVTGRTGGWTDSHLTDLGQRQARATGPAVAALLKERPFAFYGSDLARAAETAEIIARSLGVGPKLAFGLREHGNGAAANLTVEEAEKIATPTDRPTIDWVPYPGAESWRQMTERVHDFLDAVADEAELLLVVSHANAGVAVVHWWLPLGEEAWSKISFEFDLCSITHLTTNDWGERTVRKLNDTSHLGNLKE